MKNEKGPKAQRPRLTGTPLTPSLADPDPCKEPQLLSSQRACRWTPQGRGPIDHPGFERVALHQRALLLRRGKRAGIQLADADVCDLALAQVVVAVICGSECMRTYGPQCLALHPQQHLLLRQPLVYIEMITV